MFTTDSFGNIYFPAGISLASIPATTGTQARVLVPGVNGKISSATISQLITQSGSNLVSSVFGRTGAVVAKEGDYTTDQITESGEALYFSTSRVRKSIFLTTFNTSGPATYDSTTGILNIPQYGSGTASPTNFVPLTRTISINGQTADLSVDRIFSVASMVYPSAGIALSNGVSWEPSIVNNSANWNTAFSWGNHALAGYLTSFTETDPIWTSEKVNYYTKTAADARYLQSYTETDPVWTADKPNYALKTYVDTSISNLIDTAPSTLNTLNELAAALGDDANFSTTITTLIGTKEPAITAGTTAQYWRGDKSWQTLPTYDLSLYVPYTGATTNLNLGLNNLLLGSGNSGAYISMVGNKGINYINIENAGARNTFQMDSIVHTSKQFGGTKTITIQTSAVTGNNYVISFPDASGTVALTSNFSAYLPYTGATANVDLGLFGLTSRGLTISKAGSSVNGLIFEQAAGLGVNGVGFTTIGPVGTSGFGFYFGGSTQAFYFSATSITSQRVYTLPNASGTLALTSDIVAYTLPIASATVLGGIKVGSNLSIDANGILSAGNSYALPTASATVLGGIKVGTNLSIDANGILSSTDTNTTYANFTRTVSGLVPNPGGSTTTRYLREDGTWVIPPDTDTNTWDANTKTVAGYVAAPGAVANKVWKTDASGNPGWRDDADTDTNTTYTAGAGLTLTGTSFSVTKSIDASQTADTIALRNGSGQLVATGFFQASSRTLKTNITPFTRSALDIIREVAVVNFNYKTDVINKHIGFIAEDTPEELSTRNKNVMDSNNTIGVLLKAIQELESKVKELEAKCNEK